MTNSKSYRIVNTMAIRGHYAWECGSYRASCTRMLSGTACWYWKVWKTSGAFKPLAGYYVTFWQAQSVLLAHMKRLTGATFAETGKPTKKGSQPSRFLLPPRSE